MSQRAYSHLPDGTLALIREFLQNYTNEEKACETFNEIVGLSKINADEVKNLAIDEFRKEIQQLATKDELVAVKEALQAKILASQAELRTEIADLTAESKAEMANLRADNVSLKAELKSFKKEIEDYSYYFGFNNNAYFPANHICNYC